MQNAEEFVKTSIYPIIAARDAEWQARMDMAHRAHAEIAQTYVSALRNLATLVDRLDEALLNEHWDDVKNLWCDIGTILAESEAAYE